MAYAASAVHPLHQRLRQARPYGRLSCFAVGLQPQSLLQPPTQVCACLLPLIRGGHARTWHLWHLWCLQEAFLAALAEAAPDLAVTAAYGNMLPQRFLDTPRLGTLNIHPSLLPRYRGAAPVQRALEVSGTVCCQSSSQRACVRACIGVEHLLIYM